MEADEARLALQAMGEKKAETAAAYADAPRVARVARDGGVTITEIADLARVSRVTVYGWLHEATRLGESLPDEQEDQT